MILFPKRWRIENIFVSFLCTEVLILLFYSLTTVTLKGLAVLMHLCTLKTVAQERGRDERGGESTSLFACQLRPLSISLFGILANPPDGQRKSMGD
jgi:hypothetical protein